MEQSVRRSLLFTALPLFLQVCSCQAQNISGTEIPRIEIGTQIMGMVSEAPTTSAGVGVHAGCNLSHYASLDGEQDRFSPKRTFTQNAGALMGLLGVRAGVTMPRGGVYLKLRPGLVHFSGNSDLENRGLLEFHHFGLAAGFVLLRYFPNHTYLQMDASDTFLPFRSAKIMNGTRQLVRLNTTNNATISLGFGLHF
jgi:hypothetical protein